VNSWKEIEERGELKKEVSDAKSEGLRKRWLIKYREKDKMINYETLEKTQQRMGW